MSATEAFTTPAEAGSTEAAAPAASLGAPGDWPRPGTRPAQMLDLLRAAERGMRARELADLAELDVYAASEALQALRARGRAALVGKTNCARWFAADRAPAGPRETWPRPNTQAAAIVALLHRHGDGAPVRELAAGLGVSVPQATGLLIEARGRGLAALRGKSVAARWLPAGTPPAEILAAAPAQRVRFTAVAAPRLGCEPAGFAARPDANAVAARRLAEIDALLAAKAEERRRERQGARRCLRCERSFRSSGGGDRLCQHCDGASQPFASVGFAAPVNGHRAGQP